MEKTKCLNNLLKLLVILFFIISISIANSQNAKLPNTLLWKISGKDMKQPSYIFGTMHVSKKIAFHLQDSFLTAISNADYVGLEINPETWLSEMCNSHLFNELNLLYSGNYYVKNFYNTITSFNPPDAMMLRTALVDNEELINTLLYRFSNNSNNRNYEEMTYLDLYVYQLGKKLKKKIIGLEKFEESMEMGLKAMIPDEEEAKKEEDHYEKVSKTMNLLDEIESSYRNWNLSDLDSLIRLTYLSKNYEKYLIVERNKIMSNSMDSLMKLGSIFCGVGAAHLSGELGILNLLKLKGYKVNPVLGEETFSGRKQRNKIEAKNYNHEYDKYYIEDSLISYELSGKLIDIPSPNEHRFLLYPDMANGTYYVIYRLQHYSRIFGKTEKDISLSIDSLLYENIPGKILIKKKIQSNIGYPGVALSTILPNGNYMQFHIYYTPLEIVIAKAGGSKDSYKSKDWKRFFNSINFSENTISKSWNTFIQPKYNYSVELPESKAVHLFPNTSQINSRVQSFDYKDSMYYFLSVNSLNDFDYIEDDTFELNYLNYQIAKTLDTDIIDDNLEKNENSYSNTILCEFKNNPQKAISKIFVKNNKYYNLLAIGKNPDKNSKFFNSFIFIENNHHEAHYNLYDSLLFFTTITDDPFCNKKLRFKKILNGAMDRYNPYGVNYVNNYFMSQTSEYYSLDNISSIEVKRRAIDPYIQITSVEDFLKYSIPNNVNFIGNYISWENQFASPYIYKDSLATLSYLIKDSLSTRGILIKKVLKNDHLYTLSTLIDTVQGPNIWQKNFYDHFHPWDTCQLVDFNSSKSKKFISDLNKDTLLILDRILDSTIDSLIKADPNVLTEILKYLKSKKYDESTIDEKCELIEMLEYADHNIAEVLQTMSNLYDKAQDTTQLQVQILSTLAEMKNDKAMNLIRQLMDKNLPIPKETYAFSRFFFSLSDSLELCKLLYPSIFDYFSFPEYKNYILRLTAKMAQKDFLSNSMWIEHKNLILREAQAEMRRYNSELASKENKEFSARYNYGRSINKYDADLPWTKTMASKYKLACYTIILSLEYDSDTRVKKFIEKVLETKQKELVFTCAYALKGKNQVQSDTIWNWIASDDEARMYLLDWLEHTEDTLLYPQTYYSQDKMAISWLKAIPNTTEKKDSIEFIKKVLLKDIMGEGYVYFYVYKTDDDWKMNYVGFQPTDTSLMVSDYRHYSKNGIELKDKTEESLEKAIEEICIRVKSYGRKRVRNSNYDGYDDFFLNHY